MSTDTEIRPEDIEISEKPEVVATPEPTPEEGSSEEETAGTEKEKAAVAAAVQNELDALTKLPSDQRQKLRNTVASLQRAYGDKLELFDEPPGGPRFGVALPDGSLYGSVTTAAPDGLVVTIVSGGGCGE